MPSKLEIGHAYERALFAGRMDEVGSYFTDDVTYWVAGRPPLGGEWHGRHSVLRAFTNREFGLGAADWESEDIEHTWSEAGDRVVVEIHERSWLKAHPDDVLDQRTCVVLRFRGDRITEMRDYSDSQLYESFLARHRTELPKFAS